MRRQQFFCILGLGILVSRLLGAQLPGAKVAFEKLAPVSDVRADWLEGAAASPNGRFYLLSSYAESDSGLVRYDRANRSWVRLGRGNEGSSVRWSPNGRFVAYLRRGEGSRDLHVWLLPMDTATGLASGSARRVSTRPGNGTVAWSPDSRRIAFVARDSGRAAVVVVPFNGGDEEVLLRAEGTLFGVLWSPDGRSLYVNNMLPTSVRLVRVSVADKRTTDLGSTTGWPAFDISPDGKWIAHYHWSRPVLFLRSTEREEMRRVDLFQRFNRLSPFAWSRTNPGEMIAVDHISPEGIQRVSIADGQIRTLVAFDSSGIAGSALSPDERQLAYVRLRNGVTQLVVADTSGGNVRVLAEGARRGTLWSPSGQYIAYANDESDIRIVDVASRQARELVPPTVSTCPAGATGCGGRVAMTAWRSDGRALRYFERRVTAGGNVLELHEVDLDGRRRLIGTTTLPGTPSFIARNDTAFLIRQPNAVQLVKASTGTARVIYSGRARVPGTVDVNGQWLLLVADSGGNGTPLIQQPLLVSLTTGESRKYPYSLGGEVSQGFFLPDGRNFLLIACVSCKDPGYVEKWDIIVAPMNGDAPRILTGSQANFKDFWPIAVTKDGRTVYFNAQQSYNSRLATITLPRF